MARPREFDEAEVLEAAMEAFWEHGYEAVSMDQLVNATGLSRSSIYQAFDNKRGLFERALEFYVTNRVSMMVGGLEADDAGPDDVVAFFGTLDSVAEAYPDRYALGCLVTNTMTELGRADDAVRGVATDYVGRLRSAFANAISPISEDHELEGRAQMLMTLALGAFVQARGIGEEHRTGVTVDMVQSTLDSWGAPT